MHKAILFDLGRVLVHFDFGRGYHTLETLCPYSAAEIHRRVVPTGLVERFETGLVDPHDFFTQFRDALSLSIDYPRFCEIWSSIFTHELLPESLLSGLAQNYRLVLLSNTNAIHFDFIRHAYPHLIRHFHALTLSYEVHAMKPDPAIYQAALAHAGCRPEECFYTDDIPDYIAAAHALGIDAVQFEGRDPLEAALRARGIRW